MAIQFRDPFQYRLAMLESSLNPDAANPNSSAKGLFQWMPDTAAQYGAVPGDPDSELTAEEKFRADNIKALYAALQRDPSPGETYLAHQQGAEGAAKLLANPNDLAVNVVGQDEVTKNGGTPDMTAGQFADKWVKKFEDGYDPSAGSTGGVSVRMPDGTIINNVPEGTSKADLKAKLEAAGAWKPEWDSSVKDITPEATRADAETPPMGTDNSPKAVAAAQKRMDDIVANGYQGEPNKITGALSKYANGATFGFGDEISAGLQAPFTALASQFTDNPMGVGTAYNRGVADIRGNMQAIEQSDPAKAAALEVAGALTPTSLGLKVLSKVPGLAGLAKVEGVDASLANAANSIAPKATSALASWASANPKLAGALTAAATGGLYGLGNGEGDLGDRLDEAGTSAAISAPFGGLLNSDTVRGIASAGKSALASLARGTGDAVADIVPPAAPAIDSALTRLGASKAAPSIEDAASVLTPDQTERAQLLKSVGVDNPTAAMVSRDPKAWQFEQNTAGIAGVGDDLRSRYTQSNQAIQEALADLGKGFGGKASTPYEAGESVVEAVTKKNREMQDDVGKLYGQIREEKGAQTGLMPMHLINALDEASDNAYADQVVNSMQRKMKRYGLVDATGTPIEGAKINVNQAEELRKFANSMYGDKQTDRVVKSVIDGLDDDVVETAGSDAFASARDAARNRFKEFESKILGGITEGQVVPDDVLRKTVLSGKVKDVEALKNSLTSGSDDQIARGSQAWSDLKLQALQHITDAATSASGKLQGAAFEKQLDKIGKERLELLFEPDELMKLKTIQKALEYTTVEVPESFVNYSRTGAAQVNNALSGIIEKSNLGNVMEATGAGLAKLPFGLSIPGSMVGNVVRGGGTMLQDLAKQRSIDNSLNPFGSALGRYTNPASVFGGGYVGGALGQQLNQE